MCMMNIHRQLHTTYESGFTLIEILVSLTLFMIVVTISVGSLMTLVQANSKVQNIESAVENVSFALDDMTRNIRTGSNYQCPATDFINKYATPIDCATGNTSFAYTESDQSLTAGMGSQRIAYKLQGGQILQHLGTGSLGDNKWQPLTSTDVTINQLKFYVTDAAGYSAGNAYSPTVTIFVAGTVNGAHGTGSTFRLETTVNQIVLDL